MASNRSSSSTTIDVQAQTPNVALGLSRVGVTGVEKVIRIRQNGSTQLFWARFECVVELGANQKGAHMSRFEEVVNEAIGEVVLGEATGEMDFAAASKISGARFVFLKGRLAKLERAIAQFMLDLHTSEEGGYTEVNPPFLVRDNAVVSGQTTPLVISEIGIDAEVHDFADRFALAYGLVAVALAALAGWLASLPFRNA